MMMTNPVTKPLKILYGIQANGNGHIGKARTIIPELRKAGADVHCLFSGRSREALFDLDDFGDFEVREGFPIIIENGRVNILKTTFNFKARRFVKDIMNLDVSPYDLVITDFEPITAWAAKRAKKHSIGIGRQFAFHYDIPLAGNDIASHTFIKEFTPVNIGLGMHWHHFNQPILPPVTKQMKSCPSDPNKILVYMDFENLDELINLLKPFEDKNFFIYSSQVKTAENFENIFVRPLSRDGFHQDLADCGSVICNAGFELPSDVIQLGKKLLVRPLNGLMEQISSAKALKQLNLGGVMETLDSGIVAEWLERNDYMKATYPNVAEAFANWVMYSDRTDPAPLIKDLWARTKFFP
jgi:uncharacterized protein (TIGR00661 family)